MSMILAVYYQIVHGDMLVWHAISFAFVTFIFNSNLSTTFVLGLFGSTVQTSNENRMRASFAYPASISRYEKRGNKPAFESEHATCYVQTHTEYGKWIKFERTASTWG